MSPQKCVEMEHLCAKKMDEDSNSQFTSLDLYDDLITTEGIAQQNSYENLVDQHQQKHIRVQELEEEVSKLKETEAKLMDKCQTLEQNISKLFLTARLELQRKERQIDHLRNLLTAANRKMKRMNLSGVNGISSQIEEECNKDITKEDGATCTTEHTNKRKMPFDHTHKTDMQRKRQKVGHTELQTPEANLINQNQDKESTSSRIIHNTDRAVLKESNKDLNQTSDTLDSEIKVSSDRLKCDKKDICRNRNDKMPFQSGNKNHPLKSVLKISDICDSSTVKKTKMKETSGKYDKAKQLLEKSKRDIRRRSGGTAKDSNNKNECRTVKTTDKPSLSDRRCKDTDLRRKLQRKGDSDGERSVERKSSHRSTVRSDEETLREKSYKEKGKDINRENKERHREENYRNGRSSRERESRKSYSYNDQHSKRDTHSSDREERNIRYSGERFKVKHNTELCSSNLRKEKNYDREAPRSSREQDELKERKVSSKEHESENSKHNKRSSSERILTKTDSSRNYTHNDNKIKSRSPSQRSHKESRRDRDFSSGLEHADKHSCKSERVRSNDLSTPESKYRHSCPSEGKKSKSESKKLISDRYNSEKERKSGSFSEKKITYYSKQVDQKRSDSYHKNKSSSYKSQKQSRRHLNLIVDSNDSKINRKNKIENLNTSKEKNDEKMMTKKLKRSEKPSDVDDGEDWLMEPEVWFGEEDNTCTEDEDLTEDDTLIEAENQTTSEQKLNEANLMSEEMIIENRQVIYCSDVVTTESDVSSDCNRKLPEAHFPDIDSKSKMSYKTNINDLDFSESEDSDVSDLYSDMMTEDCGQNLIAEKRTRDSCVHTDSLYNLNYISEEEERNEINSEFQAKETESNVSKDVSDQDRIIRHSSASNIRSNIEIGPENKRMFPGKTVGQNGCSDSPTIPLEIKCDQRSKSHSLEFSYEDSPESPPGETSVEISPTSPSKVIPLDTVLKSPDENVFIDKNEASVLSQGGSVSNKITSIDIPFVKLCENLQGLEDLQAYKKELELQLCKEISSPSDSELDSIINDGEKKRDCPVDEIKDTEDGEIFSEEENEDNCDISDSLAEKQRNKCQDINLKESEAISDLHNKGKHVHRIAHKSPDKGFSLERKLKERRERFSQNKDCIRTSVIVLKDKIKNSNVRDSKDECDSISEQFSKSRSIENSEHPHRKSLERKEHSERKDGRKHALDLNEHKSNKDTDRESYSKHKKSLGSERKERHHSSDKRKNYKEVVSRHDKHKSRSRADNDYKRKHDH